MARPKILLYVQHLLGIGHFVRCCRVARALATDGFAVTVASGGLPTPGLDLGGARLVQLPPVKTAPDFAGLAHPDGTAFSEADRTARRDRLLRLFDDCAPDILITEAFPFGRRQMRFELLPLLEHAKAQAKPPLIAVSARDILQENRKPGRAEETAELIARYYDLVLVHGDASLCPLDETFPLARLFAEKIVYTGIVAPEATSAPADGETHDVIVSAGGGAVGAALLEAALRARPLSPLAEARWLVVAGPHLDPAAQSALHALARDGVTLARFVPDLPARLSRAKLSISQAGYNTVADLLVAGCRAVLVPFAAGGETEQPLRARLMEARGLAVTVSETDLNPQTLAAAITRALALPPPATRLALDGAENTAQLLRQGLVPS